MADQNTVKEAVVSMANLQLDSVTGEMVSKSELKKRLKLREKEAKKKEKEAAAPPKAQKKVSAEEEEANLTPNVSDQFQKLQRAIQSPHRPPMGDGATFSKLHCKAPSSAQTRSQAANRNQANIFSFLV
jgi:hypothetical protein